MDHVADKRIAWMSATADDDDARLLAAVGAGDRQALTDLYLRYRDLLFRYLLRLAPQREVAEDLLQDTFVAVWRSASGFAGRSSVQTWLIGVAHRQAHNTLRQRHAPTASLAELENAPSPEPDPMQRALAVDARGELLAAIDQLSLAHREVIALSFGAGLSAQEIATALDIPIGTVRSRLRDAKRALRGFLGAEMEGQP